MTWETGTLLELETERLTLRTMAREDVTDEFVSWLADPEVMQGLNLPRQRLTRVQAVRWVLGYDNRNRFFLGIHLQEVGLIGFFTVNCDPKHMTAETAVVIGEREHWGKDIVLEGRARLLDFLFDELSMHKVIEQTSHCEQAIHGCQLLLLHLVCKLLKSALLHLEIVVIT